MSTRLERKTAKRAAKQLAAIRAARAARRRRLLTVVGAGVCVLAAVAGLVTYAVLRSDEAAAGSSLDPALATKPEVTAGTGELTELKVTPLIEGKGATVTSGQQLSVQYVGVSYPTGEEFDSSWSGGEPFTFVVGEGQVITGWDQGLIGVRVGSRVQLDIPSALAYGDSTSNGAPAGPLRFVVDVLSAE